MAASLAALPGNEVLFASEYGRRDFSLPGVKRVLLKKPKDRKKAVASISTPALDAGERDWTMAYLRGRATASSLMGVLAEGFEPDMVILSGSMGNGLFVRNLFPEAFLVGYADWYFRDEAETRYPLSTMPDIPLAPRNIRNTLQAKNFFDCNCHFTTTEWQREQYPEGMRGFISVLRKCVDTEFFAPAPASRFSFGDCELTERQEIVTLSVRDAARLREGGFWCELPSLLSARSDCHVVLISTGKEVRLDSLRESMAAFPSGMRGRIHLLDFLPPGAYRDLLCLLAASLQRYFLYAAFRTLGGHELRVRRARARHRSRPRSPQRRPERFSVPLRAQDELGHAHNPVARKAIRAALHTPERPEDRFWETQ